MLIEIMKPDFTFEDHRGLLVQLVHQGFSQYNVIFSKKDVERGNHYHKENEEAFYVISGSLALQVTSGSCKEEYRFTKGDMFKIPAGIIHSFSYLEDTWLVSMYSIGVEKEDGSKDIFQEEPKREGEKVW